MLNSEVEPVINRRLGSSSLRWSSLLVEEEDVERIEGSLLDDVPVMLSTVLGLEMLLHETYIDLQMVSEVILRDIGATIQILRLVAREYNYAAERPIRMVDCIASLEVRAWFRAVSARTFVCDREHARTTATWKHSRLVAQYAQFVAESVERISPEDAYLVGLLHRIGTIPTVLGWPNGDLSSRGQNAWLEMVEILPPFVLAALQSVNEPCLPSPWKFILNSAEELASCGSTGD